MHLAVLGASGATGRQLSVQALERGHTVTAIARIPDRLRLPDTARLRRVSGDVLNPPSIARALAGADVLLSGLGATKGDAPGVLTAGAAAVVHAGPPRIIWLGAFGTGASAAAAGALTRMILAVALRSERFDRQAADAAVLAAGGTVFHAGPLTNGPLQGRHVFAPADVPHRLIPKTISRATVAAAMLDEAENTTVRSGQILIPIAG